MANMKAMFAQMNEIDSDPNSQKSIDYYKNLEKMEKGSKSRKPGQITIKTMRRGKSSVENITLGEDGKPLTHDEATVKKKFTDWEKYSYPETNSVDLFVPDYKDAKKKIRLTNYRYPATRERRGIV